MATVRSEFNRFGDYRFLTNFCGFKSAIAKFNTSHVLFSSEIAKKALTFFAKFSHGGTKMSKNKEHFVALSLSLMTLRGNYCETLIFILGDDLLKIGQDFVSLIFSIVWFPFLCKQ